MAWPLTLGKLIHVHCVDPNSMLMIVAAGTFLIVFTKLVFGGSGGSGGDSSDSSNSSNSSVHPEFTNELDGDIDLQ